MGLGRGIWFGGDASVVRWRGAGGLSAALERQGDLEQAELILRAAVTDSRDDPGLHAYHGLALYRLSRVVTLLDSSD